jgi:signal transduction histidine kinase
MPRSTLTALAACGGEGEEPGKRGMDQNALVYTFGAISTASVGLVFLYKWALEDRAPHDASWAVAHLALGVAIVLAAAQSQFQASLAGAIGAVAFWISIACQVRGNLQFSGRICSDPILAASVVLLAALSIPLGIRDWPIALMGYAVALCLVNLWSALVLRRAPHLGLVLSAILVSRAIIVLLRPLLLDSPYLLHYSIISFTGSFLAGGALLTGSLMRSRGLLMQSQRELSRTNQELSEAKRVLTEHNELLHAQARKLERLGADYVTALERAEGANRAKDSFIANINHELRTPLNAIIGFTELIHLRAAVGQDEKLQEYVGCVRTGAGSLLKLINRILDFVAIESGDRTVVSQPFGPRAALERELATFRELIEVKHVQVSVDCGGPDLWSGDEEAFRSVVLELISNAVKFAPPGSTIHIVLSIAADELQLSVADRGPGLSDTFIETVGEEFNISEPVLSRGGAVQGVGLGLSLAKRFVSLVGGRLLFERNAPSGTVARIVLPGRTGEESMAESGPIARMAARQ